MWKGYGTARIQKNKNIHIGYAYGNIKYRYFTTYDILVMMIMKNTQKDIGKHIAFGGI